MHEPTRRAWNKPGLIVIVRGGPQESVLLSCKGASVSGPDGAVGGCQELVAGCAGCEVVVAY